MDMYDYNTLCEIANSINDEYTKNTFLETIRRYNDCLEELQRKDNNWNELKRYIKASDDCWDLQAVLDKIEELEGRK